jgi:hypothetical protein
MEFLGVGSVRGEMNELGTTNCFGFISLHITSETKATFTNTEKTQAW